MRSIALFVCLAGFWVLCSGKLDLGHDRFFLIWGLVCCAFCTWLGRRVGAFDGESYPVPYLLRAVTYTPWLIWQIVLSNWDVTKKVYGPRSAIDPCVVRLPHDLRTPWAISCYANSITLTPGTATMVADEREMVVHCITADAARGLVAGDMLAKNRVLEGRG
jgi:multicomponent Na+:H+ antiporter subunit E